MAQYPLPQLVHRTRGRLRYRWRRLSDPALDPEYFEAWLENTEGVARARVNPRAACVVIELAPQGSGADFGNVLLRVPARAFSRGVPAPPRRGLGDAVFHAAMTAAVAAMPPGLQLPVAAAMGAPAVLKGAETLLTQGLKVRVLDMATIGFSLLRGDYVAAASISTMVVVGEFLRQATEDRSNGLLKSLVAAPVESVWVRRGDAEVAVAFADVVPGDLVLAGSGGLVAVDGLVVAGEALLDCSSITGESAPVYVKEGAEILSGCVVREGAVTIEARRTGAETNMARISGFMENALREVSARERRSDRLADMLAPITLGLGAVLYAATHDASRALSVLTIDYACAVKLPAPVVIKTSLHTAAREGVLIKSGSGLDAFAEADTLVFDKTGTLTTGRLRVTDVLTAGVADDEFIRLAASVEDRSDHPVGQAVVAEAARRGLELLPAGNACCSIAHGIEAVVAGRVVRVGSHHYIAEDCGISCAALAGEAERLRSEAKTLVFVASGDSLLGLIALRDEIRPEACDVLRQMRLRGIRHVYVLTGDHARTAETLLAQVPGIDGMHTDLLPEEKAAFVKDLRSKGHKVAMIGDGVNDAPAFVAADVGVSLSRTQGLARESARIVLLRDALHGLVVARDTGLRAAGILDNCFTAGVGINTGLLLVAGAGLLSPVAAAAVHNATTFAILGGSAWAAGRRPAAGQQTDRRN